MPSTPSFAKPPATPAAGSQTLLRGLDVLEAVAERPLSLTDLAAALSFTRSTTHRLAGALVDRGYLVLAPGTGYRCGPRLLELGFLAHRQADILVVARPHIEALAIRTEDTVHLGVIDGDRALYLDKKPGRRRVEIRSRVGDRHPLTATGVGKALLLDHPPARWRALFDADRAAGAPAADYALWSTRMAGYVAAGRACDLEENQDQIRCVAAPVRGADAAIVAAISVSSAAQYMDDARMAALGHDVRAAADGISHDLGWNGRTHRKD